jgi:hypothetical protein
MSAKIECPFTVDELRNMYVTQRVDAVDIASQVGVSRSTIATWLRSANITRLTNRRVRREYKSECPFSKDRLHELYWRDRLTLAQIAIAAHPLLSYVVSCSMVLRWMNRYGIDTRTKSEARKLAMKRNPKLKENLHGQGGRGMGWNHVTTKQMRRNASKARKARHEMASETRQCVWCGIQITKARSRFVSPPERTYCSRRCVTKHRHLGFV